VRRLCWRTRTLKNKESNGTYRLAARIRFVDCCLYLSSIPKFNSPGRASSRAGGNGSGNSSDIGSNVGSGNGGGSGGGSGGTATAAADASGRNVGDGGSSPGVAADDAEEGTSSLPTTAVAMEPQAISSLRTVCRPLGTKRKAAFSTIENGQGPLARAVNSVGKAIEKNGKSRERAANLALQYRLISKAGFSDEQQQAAYRKLLADTEL
jgi:hypothetical protein